MRLEDQQTLAALWRAANANEDIWEGLISAGQGATADEMDRAYYVGHLAALAGKQYGSDRLGEFARHMSIARSTLKERRKVAEFYAIDVWEHLRQTSPQLGWKHFYYATRLKVTDEAVIFLQEVAENGLTVEHTLIQIKDRLGTPTPPKTYYSGEAAIARAILQGERVMLELCGDVGLLELDERRGEWVTVLIRERRE